MKSLDFRRYALTSYVATALLAGCGGSQPPIAAPGAMPQTSAIATHAARGTSWMLPEAKGEDLVYVATGDDVYVLSYPHGKLVGNLGVVGNSLCSDNQGDVFIPSGSYKVLEYAHGGSSPIQTLYSGDIPLGCAVDPTSGNLAVTNEASGAGEVAIFANAKGTPTWYRDQEIFTYGLCAYDDRGNLFVDGSGTGNFLAELSKGRSAFRNYALNGSFDAFGSVQWDGKHITLSNPTTEQIYRLRFGKSSFKVLGTTQIDGWQNDYSGHWPYIQTWLQGSSFIAQSSTLAELGLWRYPQGGKASKVIGPFKSGTVNIHGVTVSLAPNR
ncbi:MAG TPA: hypothetical protein VFE35_06860 [Candidatus Cybelea sp.]|jgi:hypothetical protein|nr:hypothetical protein [Candidatus Cybelea sp.]